jgi:glycosyltransferase involved in cell wall biosynthesis
MNIWLLHPFAGGPGLGRHWRPYWLADAWQRMGHRPLVISAAVHHLHREPPSPGLQHIGGVDFWFVETPKYNGNLGRLWNNFSFGSRFRRDAKSIANACGKPDLIIASSPHLFFVSAAHRVARRFDARFWLEVRDLWPESIVALGMTPAWHPLVRLLDWKERSAYKDADRVVSLLSGAEGHMRSRGLAPGKFVWIPNGLSEQDLQSALNIERSSHPLVERINSFKQQGKRVVIYAGSMGPPNGVEVIVDAARVLWESGSAVQFVLVGSGTSRAELEQRAAGLPNVEFFDEVDRPIAHAMMHASDCAIVSFRKTPLFHHGISPNKLFDYCLFAPRTVIACEPKVLAGFEDLVTARCEPDDPAALAAALTSAMLLPARPLQEGFAVARRYSYAELGARYLAE